MPCRVCRLSGRTVYRCHWLVIIAFMNARKRSSAVRRPRWRIAVKLGRLNMPVTPLGISTISSATARS